MKGGRKEGECNSKYTERYGETIEKIGAVIQ